MKTKRFLKVFIIALVCMALIVPAFQVAGADSESGVAIDAAANPELYHALIDYGSPRAFDVDDNGTILITELQDYDNATHQMNLDGDYLTTQHGRLTSVEGLQYLTHITRLELQHNSISDITPIADITALAFLDLSYNHIRDLDPFAAHLPNLSYFDFGHNSVPSIYALYGKTSLQYLHFAVNQVTDLWPLLSLTSLSACTISWNALNPGVPGIMNYTNIKAALTSVSFTDEGQNSYDISYIANGSSTRTSDTGKRYGDFFDPPVAYRPDETYMGWDWDGNDTVDFGRGISAFTPPVSTLAPSDTHVYSFTLTAVYRHSNADIYNPGNNRGTLAYYDSISHYDLVLDPWDRNVTLHPQVVESHATYTIDGESVTSKTFNCNPGVPVTATILVTAENGITTRTYTVDIMRDRPQLGKLAGFTYDAGTLSPDFRPLTSRYTLTLDESTGQVTITPEKSYVTDIVSPASRTVTLAHKGDSRTVTFNVRSGVNRNFKTTYTVKVVRARSALAQLQYIKVNNVPLAGFDPAILTGYTVSIPWQKSTATVKVKEVEKGSIVRIEGARTTSRTFTLRHPGDSRDVHIRVVSPNGSTTVDYVVTIKRDPAPTDATLSDIRVNGVTLTGFAPATLDYTLTVPSTLRKAAVRVTLNEPHATVKINRVRTKVLTVPLVLDVPRIVTIEVKAADGATILTYHVTITRSSVL